MKKIICTLILSIAAGALAVGGAYLTRGYWAVGAEWTVPVITAALLLYMEGEENEQRD